MASTGNVEANKSTTPDATASDDLPLPSEVETSPKQPEETAVPKAEEGEKQVAKQPAASETEESTRLMPHTMPESAEELPAIPENNEPSTSAPAVTTETDQQQLQTQDQGEAQEARELGEQGESQQVREPDQTERTPTSNDAALAATAASTTTAQPSNPTQPSKDAPESDENRPSSSAALEPSPSNATTPAGKEPEGTGPVLQLNLLLTSGSRHPFKIDGKYLQKRGVIVPDNDPYQMSVYTLKELVWKEWRSGIYDPGTLCDQDWY